MVEKGWIHRFAFENNALSADSDGRSAMQDGFLVNDKIATGTITAVKLASNVLYTGTYGSSRYGAAVYA